MLSQRSCNLVTLPAPAPSPFFGAKHRRRPTFLSPSSSKKKAVSCCYGEETCYPSDVARNCTYGASENTSAWLEKELPHLLSTQKKIISGLVLTRGKWKWNVKESTHYKLHGDMTFWNVTKKNEIFVTEVAASGTLLSSSAIDQVTTSIQVHSNHPDGRPPRRRDGYWPAYILKAGKATHIEVDVDIISNKIQQLADLQALRLELRYIAYGPVGRFLERQHVILPLLYPTEAQRSTWHTISNGVLMPIKTHLLCHMDDPLEVLNVYAIPHAREGDTIVVGETPLAIMQGRFRHPTSVTPSLMAQLACKLFHPTSSLATACGMQALLDIVGRVRVVLAVVVAVIGRFIGIRGVFYRLAGEQARLIDDVTGTLPPYDQFVTLGPVHAQATADSLQQRTGFGVAIVDANNLGGVHILAASSKVDGTFLKSILKTNPAGNDDEQTPLVIVRPLQKSSAQKS